MLDIGVLASYQQCHFTPVYWRNSTVIGTEGRIENFGDDDDAKIKLWTTRSDAYRGEADELIPVPPAAGGHGGGDPLLINEFVRFALEGGPTMTSPIAARHSVAATVAGTTSLRTGGGAVQVPPVRPEVVGYFANDQTAGHYR